MKLYHGSYCEVKKPDISFSRDSLDFGKGFYLTDIKKQALDWIDRFIQRGKAGCLNTYRLDLECIKDKYKVKEFISYDMEWLDFILDCRNSSKRYLEYDVIIGGIADDKVYNTIELYEYELITKEEALKRLKYHKPNNQICITNQEVLDIHLEFNLCEVISDGSE
ncbi:DUF3990 domain-containing protein [Romboutsia sedimentorum]|uniref:DUF3990 domain-containing protein n=1 Tax=Romboutsia sedimentorum TaxID=1368474 RepID=UPI0024DED2A8|nr:DUF3990 domain-containing protein [Romboutsia sedimentorum]MDK2584485.1 DUF3990 domain-containing protein [Romboutsia sedimentorum]